MKSSRAALRYAKAFLNFALENKQEELVAKEMQRVLSIINESSELGAALDNPTLSGSKKRKIMSEVFKSNSKTMQSLFSLLSTNKREGILGSVADQYSALYDKYQGIVEATVITSIALTREGEKKVLEKASLLTSLKVQLKNIIDPTIKGGFILRVGDLQYNASVLDRLERLKRELITP
jgi:F-type H+-transporting ATPase subunit delta